MAFEWQGALGPMEPRSYVCGYCDHHVGSDRGWWTKTPNQARIYLCSYCSRPTFFDFNQQQYPGPACGNDVGSVPKDVGALYAEARFCATVNSFTSAVLTCRKLLMHIAVEKGAPLNKSFMEYVEYLAVKGYVPPGGEGWVHHIRKKGNEANHEISVMSSADATDLITFSEMLLKFVYEFPAKVKPPATT
jgi:hypothetical protein